MWIFHNRHSFRKYRNHFCLEPPITSFDIKDYFFDVKLRVVDNKLHLIVFNSRRLVYDFIVVEIGYSKLEGVDKYVVITMVNVGHI